MRCVHAFLGVLLLILISACDQTNDSPENFSIESKANEVLTEAEVTKEQFSVFSKTNNPNTNLDYDENNLEKIYFAGGCFWGVEAYFERIYGVYDVTSGYANGTGENPTYEDVIKGDEGFAETVEVLYDPERISLDELLTYFFKVIDPTMLNQQGNDIGIQYRTGIYYQHDSDASLIETAVEKEQKSYDEKIVTEVLPEQR
ncbi:peptide-methionine (S)-S-oxide reductase MsrA [Virgibacillus sp. W0181]|uniref:peptide-methionine (S)-S-oxide reductase MsrA n=1 Tax=Virgibacillus sp. W0181 TaxID=3391581 RepID=UPI003F458286